MKTTTTHNEDINEGIHDANKPLKIIRRENLQKKKEDEIRTMMKVKHEQGME